MTDRIILRDEVRLNHLYYMVKYYCNQIIDPVIKFTVYKMYPQSEIW